MFIIITIMAIAAVVAGILIAVCSKKVDGVVYGKLDKAGRITNILLIPVYAGLSLFSMGISIFVNPGHDGFLGVLGWIVAIIITSAPLSCGLGLGFSVALRKKGKSKQSFAMQFLGLAGVALSVSLFLIFYGNLLRSLN